MHITEVIKKPVLTEKSYLKINVDGKYTFEVNYKANKVQIKKAFETIFEVKVLKINIIKKKPKAKKIGRFEGLTNANKRAIITLKPGEKLELFNNE
ncbi:50S ribosomal protein L23 [Spiroplasma endosymbiont of Agriotes lineatus]|uniref:50S ribosomal protein L23 n=1 Tax=Spiroplasma endosymbiont of Agriotes lineatus TaxID=3077930 RepID=UPI0030D40928